MRAEADDEGYGERLERLAADARRLEHEVEVKSDVDEETAMQVVSEGVGPTVSLYVEHRTGGTMAPFTSDEMRTLEEALNTYLEIYCRCYGFDLEFDYTVRGAADVLVETHDARAVAEVLTKVPDGRTT